MHSAEPKLLDALPYFLPILLNIPLILILSAKLISADPPFGDRALWRTQPVQTLCLVCAKILFLCLFCILIPLLLKTFALALYGFSWLESWPILQAYILLLACGWAVVLLPALLFGRTHIGCAVFGALVLLILFSASMLGIPEFSFSLGAGSTAVLCATTLVVFIYVYKKHRRSDALIVLVTVLILTSGFQYWRMHNPPAIETSLPPTVGSDFSFNVKVNEYSPISYRGGEAYLVGGNLSGEFPRTNQGTVFFPQKCDWTIQWPDRTISSDTYWMINGFEQSTDSEKSAIISFFGLPLRYADAIQAFGAKRLLVPVHPEHSFFAVFSPAIMQRLQKSSAELRGKFSFVVGHFEEISRLPLSPGSISRVRGCVFGLNSHGFDKFNELTLSLVDLSPSVNAAPPWRWGMEFDLLVNPKRGEAMTGMQLHSSQEFEYETNIADFKISQIQVMFQFGKPDSMQYMTNNEMAAWLADAQYVRIRFVPEGIQSCNFTCNL